MKKKLIDNLNPLKNQQDLLEEGTRVFLSDGLDQVLSKVVQAKLNRVVVVDNSNRVQGIISPKDILRALHGRPNGAAASP